MLTFFIEIPKGQRNKYGWTTPPADPAGRMLFTSTRYPADYEFIEDTLADNGDRWTRSCCSTSPSSRVA